MNKPELASDDEVSPRAQAMTVGLVNQGCKDRDVRVAVVNAAACLVANVMISQGIDDLADAEAAFGKLVRNTLDANAGYVGHA